MLENTTHTNNSSKNAEIQKKIMLETGNFGKITSSFGINEAHAAVTSDNRPRDSNNMINSNVVPFKSNNKSQLIDLKPIWDNQK